MSKTYGKMTTFGTNFDFMTTTQKNFVSIVTTFLYCRSCLSKRAPDKRAPTIARCAKQTTPTYMYERQRRPIQTPVLCFSIVRPLRFIGCFGVDNSFLHFLQVLLPFSLMFLQLMKQLETLDTVNKLPFVVSQRLFEHAGLS